MIKFKKNTQITRSLQITNFSNLHISTIKYFHIKSQISPFFQVPINDLFLNNYDLQTLSKQSQIAHVQFTRELKHLFQNCIQKNIKEYQSEPALLNTFKYILKYYLVNNSFFSFCFRRICNFRTFVSIPSSSSSSETSAF